MRIIVGSIVAPILANIYMALLENELRKKCMLDPQIKWSVLLKTFIDDGFGIFEGTKIKVEYWINQFNLLRETIKIDKWSYGTHIQYIDLEIYRGARFFEKRMFEIHLHQKPENKFLYFPAKADMKHIPFPTT